MTFFRRKLSGSRIGALLFSHCKPSWLALMPRPPAVVCRGRNP